MNNETSYLEYDTDYIDNFYMEMCGEWYVYFLFDIKHNKFKYNNL